MARCEHSAQRLRESRRRVGLDKERSQPAKPTVATAPRRGRGGPRQAPWILVVPALLFALGMHFAAPLAGAWYAFTDWHGIGAAHWIGLANFREILSTNATRGALFNTLKLAFSFVVIVNALGLALALALNRVLK